jgi:hypothetical protein
VDCSELIGRDPLGDDVFRLSLDQNNFARQHRDSALIYGARLGHLLYVALTGQIVAMDTRQRSAETEGDFLWRAYPMGRYYADAMRGRRPLWMMGKHARPRPVYHPFSDRKRMLGVVGTAVGALGPVTPRGVVFQEQNQLKCVDPLSGETVWTRNDLPAGCELFGDGDFVFAADMSEHEAYVVRMTDGRLEGKRELPKSEWLLTAGRNIAVLGSRSERERRDLLLNVVDLWSQKKLFDAEFPNTSRISIVEPHSVAVCQPSGKFQLIDVRTGRPSIDQQLESVPDLQSVQTLRCGDTLFVVIGVQVTRQQQHKPIGQFDYPIVSGQVYAFNLNDGKLQWPGPATIRNRGVVFQPEDIPFLVFADRQMSSEGAGGGKWNMRLLCLDKQTGETVYRNDKLPDAANVTRFRLRGEHDKSHMVTMHTNAGTISLTMTDRPRPPRPPANDDLETTPTERQRGLVGLGERMGSALRGVIELDSKDGRPPRGDEVPEQIDDD